MDLRFYDTSSREKKVFVPQTKGVVGFYSCGPTVYDVAHIGNLRAYLFSDLLRRALQANGYEVTQVINITDVGHLTSDADKGEDKMSRALQREGMELTLDNMSTVAEKYVLRFTDDLSALNILAPHVLPRASGHISEQIALIGVLLEKGYAYQTSDGVYFDAMRFETYGKMARLNLSGQREGSRVAANEEKKSPADFALWKFNSNLGWESPWGRGFPGWHIECSAMAMKYLGETLDIHTGGIDHIPTHHTNEIAQSEAATGKPFANYWMHSAFMTVEGEKMSKSLGNTYTLDDLSKKGVSPLAYRLLVLGAHYRSQMNFVWEGAEAAERALRSLRQKLQQWPDGGEADDHSVEAFMDFINDDLDTPNAMALLWGVVKGGLPDAVKKATLIAFDSVLGLELAKAEVKTEAEGTEAIPAEAQQLMHNREVARKEKQWAVADQIRRAIEALGYEVEDTAKGSKLKRV